MSDKSKNTPSRIRTFAGDLEMERSKTNKRQPAAPTPKIKKKLVPQKSTLKKAQKPKKPLTKKEPLIVVSKPKKTKSKLPTPPKPKKIPAKATKIPAFHELNKHPVKKQENIVVTDKSNNKKPKQSKLDNSKKVPKANIGYDATIITDTKSDRFKLFPSIVDSVKNWFKVISANRKRKSAPKYSVTETNRRKGIIQKATSNTGTMFSTDNDSIKEQIRLRNQEEIDSETSWSPYTETGYDLLEAPDSIQNVTVEYKQQPVIVEPSKKHSLIETAAPRQAPPPSDIEPEISENHNENIESINESRWTASRTNFNQDTYQESDLEATVNPATKLPKATHRSRNDYQTSDFLKSDTNTMTIAIIIMVVCTVVIIFSVRVVMQQMQSRTDAEVLTTSTESVLQNSELSNVILTASDINRLPSLIKSGITAAPAGLVELPIISPIGDEVAASYIFELLDFQALPNLKQSITIARFTTVNRSAPSLTLQFVDINTVRGGLLNWEQTMAADLSSLYDLPKDVTNKFVDDKIDGLDVRVLTHDNRVILVYGIIGANTALISPDTAVFAQINKLGLSH